MEDLASQILNPVVGIYLLIVFSVQLLAGLIQQQRQVRVTKRRLKQGLVGPVLINHSEQLGEGRRAAFIESSILIISVILVPFLFAWLLPKGSEALKGLGLTFGTLLIWLLFSGTEIAKAFLGGVLFKTLVTFKRPFQIGDRISIKGVSGKVIGFGTFFVELQTPNDDLVSVPTYTLWSEVLTSTNSGDRSSLCVMDFYLASFVSAKQRQEAEDAIWDAIQASIYYEPAKPMQIYLSQTQDAIRLTAKAYVASTYNEPLFSSDVTRSFLDFASQRNIALAPSTWEAAPSLTSQES